MSPRTYFETNRPGTQTSVRGHTLVVEKALGRSLRRGAEVHHVDGDGANNEPSNLVVCHDHAYHALLEQRTRAQKVCGNASWRMCRHCKQYDAPENMSRCVRRRGDRAGSNFYYHAECDRINCRARVARGSK
jgi:hypothetical protein